MNMTLKSFVCALALLPSLIPVRAEEQSRASADAGLQKADSCCETKYFLPEEEVLGWCSLDPDSLKGGCYTDYGYTWHSIYESVKRDSFAYVPFSVEVWGDTTRSVARKLLAHKRKDCGCPFANLIIVNYRSPDWTWGALCAGRGFCLSAGSTRGSSCSS